MKYNVTSIPNPFEMKRKHAIPPFTVSYNCNRNTDRSSAAGTKASLNHKGHEEFEERYFFVLYLCELRALPGNKYFSKRTKSQNRLSGLPIERLPSL
jgi:hypothetical protein